MRAYIYKPEDIGIGEWPSGQLRLDGFEPTESPENADVFVCPGPLLMSQNVAWLDRFPYMPGNEKRHVFFDCSDHDTIFLRRECILIRCNLKRFMLDAHPNSIPWAWPVEDFAECIEVPVGGFKYDVSFQGWLSTLTRTNSSNACRNNSELKSDIATYKDFCGYIYHEPEGVRRREEFRRSMRESRLALCPESIEGVFPYRFFEAMSAARVPVLVSSDYVFPFSDEIDYKSFCILVERRDAGNVDKIILDFLRNNNDERIVEMGMLARSSWQNFLNREDWPTTMAYAVRKKLAELGLVTCA